MLAHVSLLIKLSGEADLMCATDYRILQKIGITNFFNAIIHVIQHDKLTKSQRYCTDFDNHKRTVCFIKSGINQQKHLLCSL